MSKWLLLTAGLGSCDFEESAKRVARQASAFGVFDKIISLDTDSVLQICTRVAAAFPDNFHAKERGFGFMTWKSELVLSALEGRFGEIDGVLWVDGGCEVNVNYLSRRRLKKILRVAEKTGVAAFTLNTPECSYTKADLIARFNFIDSPESFTPQFQTTWFALSGKTGLEIAKQWLEITLEDYSFSNIEPSKLPEAAGYIENRYDQSIFSLVCKKNKVQPMRYLAAAGRTGIRSEIRGLIHPLWTSRNRKGESLLPRWILNLQQNLE